MTWNFDFVRCRRSWTDIPLEDLAMKYDTVEEHGWYGNLNPLADNSRDP